MCDRQTLQFVETVARDPVVPRETLLRLACSDAYARALAGYAAATHVQCASGLQHAGAGSAQHGNELGTEQNRVQAADLFSREASVIFQFDWIGDGTRRRPGNMGLGRGDRAEAL